MSRPRSLYPSTCGVTLTDHRRNGSTTGAPKLEPALFTQAATLIAPFAAESTPAEFHAPSIDEFFPEPSSSSIGIDSALDHTGST